MGRVSNAGWLSAEQVDDGGHAAYRLNVNIVGGSGSYTGPLAAQFPATLGAKTGANSLSVVWASDSVATRGATALTTGPQVFGFGSSTSPTAVTNGQAVSPWLTLNGATVSALGGVQAPSNTFTAVLIPGDVTGAAPRPIAAASYVWNGTAVVARPGDNNAAATQPSLTSLFWSYAAASGGITNTTTAVTIKAAAGASVRNYIEALQIDWNALGAATEFAIRDGAGGTVLWRMQIGTGAAGSRAFNFRPALRGTANTLLEVVTLTASVTGSVYVNAQGWTGA